LSASSAYLTISSSYPAIRLRCFEEFLWANGIGEAVIDSVKSCFENEKAVPDGIHSLFDYGILEFLILLG